MKCAFPKVSVGFPGWVGDKVQSHSEDIRATKNTERRGRPLSVVPGLH